MTHPSHLIAFESGRGSVGRRGVRRRAVAIVRHANSVLRAGAAAEEAEQRGRRRGEGVENGGGAEN